MRNHQPITAIFINPPKACIHLRGTVTDTVVDGKMVRTGHTQCGLPITSKLHVPGLPGFRLAHSIRRDSVCQTCLTKSAKLKNAK